MILIITKNGLYPAEHCLFKRTIENGEDYLMLSCNGTAEFFRVMNFDAVLEEINRQLIGAIQGNYFTVSLQHCIEKGERSANK